jgi:hypothetical protein
MSNPEIDLSRAEQALAAFAAGPAQDAANAVEAHFSRAASRIAAELGKAASDGELSFRRLAKVALEELARIALSQARGASGGERAPTAMNFVFNVQGGAEAGGALRQSARQAASQVAMAAIYGRRNL